VGRRPVLVDIPLASFRDPVLPGPGYVSYTEITPGGFVPFETAPTTESWMGNRVIRTGYRNVGYGGYGTPSHAEMFVGPSIPILSIGR